MALIASPRFVAFAPGLYRSPLPLAREIRAFVELGGRAVVDLTRRPRPTVERACRRYGILYSKFGLPYEYTEDEIDAATEMVLECPRPALIHCFHGRDRTGALVVRLLAILEECPC